MTEKMKEFLRLLDLSPMEEFRLSYSDGFTRKNVYRFDTYGYLQILDEETGWTICYLDISVLLKIFRGSLVIVKIQEAPFFPEPDGTFYYPARNFDAYSSKRWTGCPTDLALQKAGMAFNTVDLLKSNLPRLRKEYLESDKS